MSLGYPVHLHLEGRLCLIVGGGPVAERRAEGLLDAGATVLVVSPSLTPGLQAMADSQKIRHRRALYVPGYLSGVSLVIAATDSRETNAAIAGHARDARILVNVVDLPEDGDFNVPSVIRRGDLCLSIATGGANPMLTKRLAAELAERFGPEYAGYVELLGAMRVYIKGKTESLEHRRKALAALLAAEDAILEPLRQGSQPEATRVAAAVVDAALDA